MDSRFQLTLSVFGLPFHGALKPLCASYLVTLCKCCYLSPSVEYQESRIEFLHHHRLQPFNKALVRPIQELTNSATAKLHVILYHTRAPQRSAAGHEEPETEQQQRRPQQQQQQRPQQQHHHHHHHHLLLLLLFFLLLLLLLFLLLNLYTHAWVLQALSTHVRT